MVWCVQARLFNEATCAESCGRWLSARNGLYKGSILSLKRGQSPVSYGRKWQTCLNLLLVCGYGVLSLYACATWSLVIAHERILHHADGIGFTSWGSQILRYEEEFSTLPWSGGTQGPIDFLGCTSTCPCDCNRFRQEVDKDFQHWGGEARHGKVGHRVCGAKDWSCQCPAFPPLQGLVGCWSNWLRSLYLCRREHPRNLRLFFLHLLVYSSLHKQLAVLQIWEFPLSWMTIGGPRVFDKNVCQISAR